MSKNRDKTPAAMSAAAFNGLLRKHGQNLESVASGMLNVGNATVAKCQREGVTDPELAQRFREEVPKLKPVIDASEEPTHERPKSSKAKASSSKGAKKAKSTRKRREPKERPAPPANRPNSATYRRHFDLKSTQIQRSLAIAGYTVDQVEKFLRSLGDRTNRGLIRLRCATLAAPNGWVPDQVERYGALNGDDGGDFKDLPAELRKAINAEVGKPEGEPIPRPEQKAA